MMRGRRGFSFIELLVVFILIGLIARIAVPRYGDMKRRAIAGAILGEIHTIRIAAYAHYSEKSEWPADYGPGIVPTELVTYLPRNFRFTRDQYEYDYEQWELSEGTPGNPQERAIVALSVTSSEPRIIYFLLKQAGKGYIPFASANKVTFLLSGVSGQ